MLYTPFLGGCLVILPLFQWIYEAIESPIACEGQDLRTLLIQGAWYYRWHGQYSLRKFESRRFIVGIQQGELEVVPTVDDAEEYIPYSVIRAY